MRSAFLRRSLQLQAARQPLPLSSLSPGCARSFAGTTGKAASGKTPSPSNTPDSGRRTGDYGPGQTGQQVPMQQEGQSHSQQQKAAHASSSSSPSSSSSASPSQSGIDPSSHQSVQAEKAKQGKDASTSRVTPTPHEAQHRKASGKSATHGSSPVDVHRKQEDYTRRDSGTGAEQSVAADRAAHDPLPDHQKHSVKSKSGKH